MHVLGTEHLSQHRRRELGLSRIVDSRRIPTLVLDHRFRPQALCYVRRDPLDSLLQRTTGVFVKCACRAFKLDGLRDHVAGSDTSMHVADAHHRCVHRIHGAARQCLERRDHMGGHDNRVDTEVRHRRVPALAGDDELHRVGCRHHRSRHDRSLALRELRPVVHPENKLAGKSLEESFANHLSAATVALFGRLNPDALSFWKDLAGLRRTLKVRADSAITSRFVCEVMGIEHGALSPDEQLDASENFARREQLVSFEQSMTQRIQLVQLRGSRRRYLAGGSVAVAAGVAAALLFPWSGFNEGDGARSAVLGTSISAELTPPATGAVENTSFATLVDEAHRLGARGRFRAAMTAYQAAVDLDSDSLDARLGLAESAFRLRDYPQARSVIDGVLNDVPDEPRALLLNAGLLRAIGHPPDAKAAFQEVVAAAPESDHASIAAATLERWVEPTDTNTDTEADIPTEVDPDGDVDSDTDTDAIADVVGDTDAYPDLDADADAVVDTDGVTDTELDAGTGADFDDEP